MVEEGTAVGDEAEEAGEGEHVEVGSTEIMQDLKAMVIKVTIVFVINTIILHCQFELKEIMLFWAETWYVLFSSDKRWL